MTVQQLKYVLAVYQAGSISKAAQVLYVAQPNLSAAIKKLEAEIRIELFTRTSNGMINLMTLNTGYTPVGNAYQLTDSTDENKTIFNGETIVAYNTAYNSNAVATQIAADPTLTAKLNNAKTVLLVIDGDDEVTVYNGAGNLPVILSSTLDANRRIIVRGLVKNSSSAYVAYMAVDLGAMETDEYEIIDTSATPDYMFLLDEVSEIHAANGEIYYTYETLMSDGTVEKVTFDATSAANQYNLIYKAHYNKDDYVTSSTAVSNTTPYFNNVYTGANAFAGLSYADGAMQIIDQDGSDSENFIVTDDTKIVLIADGDTGLCRYDGVSYEVNEVKASYLDSVLDGYLFAGRIAGKTVEANSNVLETMYIFVDQLWDNTNSVAVGTNDCGFGI